MIKNMQKFKLFDSHTHAYPDEIAEKARINLAKFYDFDVPNVPTVAELINSQKESGSSGFALFSVATNPEQVIKINNWLASVKNANENIKDIKIILFAAMHQDLENKAAELERVLKLGFKGVKIHPDIQQVDIDSPKLMDLYESAEGRAMIYFHAGDERYDYSLPEKIIKIKEMFPKLEIIAAHLGGYQKWETAITVYKNQDIYFDTSSALWALPPCEARRIIINYNPDKILFGTDYPIRRVRDELGYLEKLNLSGDLLEKILYKNAAKLFGL
jgi:predicted TIM-barrel fold metal-dependent hydrolase